MMLHALSLTRRFLLTTAVLALAWSAHSSAAVSVAVAGNQATAEIQLGTVEAELILSFDAAENLSPAALNISAQLVSLADPLLLARLPSGGLTSLPSALPLLITVEPPNGSGFALNNTVRVEIHTHALPYTAGSHFRLYKAPLGGSFKDITDEVAPGSVRARGTTGGFSQFLILTDLRPSSSVIAGKLAELRTRCADAPAALSGNLQSQLDAVEAALDNAAHGTALAALEQFRADVSAAAGNGLSNRWTPSDRSHNVAGDLLAAAASLKFSIGYLRDWGE